MVFRCVNCRKKRKENPFLCLETFSFSEEAQSGAREQSGVGWAWNGVLAFEPQQSATDQPSLKNSNRKLTDCQPVYLVDQNRLHIIFKDALKMHKNLNCVRSKHRHTGARMLCNSFPLRALWSNMKNKAGVGHVPTGCRGEKYAVANATLYGRYKWGWVI